MEQEKKEHLILKEMRAFKPNENFVYYLYWICERQNIFWKRFNNEPTPHTDNEILQNFKFCNVYRVLDRSSQYLIKNVIQNGKEYSPEDIIYRILIYKHFNLPATWEALISEFGDININVDNNDLISFFRNYSKNNVCYSNAYVTTAPFVRSTPIMSKYRLTPEMSKYELYINIFYEELVNNDLFSKLLWSKTFEQCFNSMKLLPGVAGFMGYQFVQDLNYTNLFNFDDNEFCAAGPGTQRGIERTFDITGTPNYSDIVKWVQKNFEQLLEDYSKEFDIELKFKSIPNWLPKVPDFSNCFCETDKMMRGMGVVTEGKEVDGKRIKNSFQSKKNNIEYVFPTKWNVGI